MNWKNYLLVATATFLILLAGITSFLIVQSNNTKAEEDGQSNTNTTEESASSNEESDIQISITNNIQTVVNGESSATVDNKVKNDISDANTKLENNIQNETKDQASITVNNGIENILKGDLQGTLRNNITNNILSSGKSELANSILNDLQTKVQVDLTNEVNNNGKQAEPPKPPENNSPPPTEQTPPSNNTNNPEQPPSDPNAQPSNNNTENAEPTYIWGIDSASETTENFYACVRENFGEPKIFARYLGTKEGVSSGLTAEQIELIHANGADILPIYNGFTDATGYDNGVNQAQQAITLANDVGIPDGVAIFADIEPTYPVDAAFIQGWYDGITSSNYKPAIYGSFDPDNAIVSAFNEAVKQKQDIQQNTYLWSSSPSIGVSPEAEAPSDYTVDAPEGSLSYGWQYGINSETCNIDTNLFDSRITEALWRNEG